MAGATRGFRSGRLSVVPSLVAKPLHGDSGLPLTRADWYRAEAGALTIKWLGMRHLQFSESTLGLRSVEMYPIDTTSMEGQIAQPFFHFQRRVCECVESVQSHP